MDMYELISKFVSENQELLFKITKFKPKTVNNGFFMKDFTLRGKEVDVDIEYWEVFNEDEFNVKKFKVTFVVDKGNALKYKRGSFLVKE